MNPADQQEGTSRWLVIETEQERRVFVFRPKDDHTIVVGSERGAHFQVRGAASLCFYVERAEDRLQLVPAYVGNLRLNSHRVTERVPLPQNGIVEFGEFRLHLTVQEVPPQHDDVTASFPVSPKTSASVGDKQYDDAMATRVAVFESQSDVHGLPTTATEGPSRPAEATGTAAIEFAQTEEVPVSLTAHVEPRSLEGASNCCPSLEDDHPALATQIMGSPSGFEDELPPRSASTTLDTGSDRTEGIPFQEFVPSTGKSTAVQPGVSTGLSTKGSGGTVPPVLKENSQREAAQPGTTALAGIRSSMNRLGTWAQTRPVFAIGGGVAGALILGLAIGGVSKVLSPPLSTAAKTPSVATSMKSTSPESKEVAEPVSSKDKSELVAARDTDEVAKSSGDVKADAETHAAEEKTHADEVNRAVEHLVAGRDDEAAHAYQSIAQTKYATEQLKRMSELMQKRTNAQQKKKPAAHQVPELYR